MRKIGRGVAHGGTYTPPAHSVSLAAAEKCLQILDETDALERIAEYGTTRACAMGMPSRPRRPRESGAQLRRPSRSMSGPVFFAGAARNYRA